MELLKELLSDSSPTSMARLISLLEVVFAMLLTAYAAHSGKDLYNYVMLFIGAATTTKVGSKIVEVMKGKNDKQPAEPN